MSTARRTAAPETAATKTEEELNELVESNDGAESVDVPAKRGRGRPRKDPSITVAALKKLNGPIRPRGRPKKTYSPEELAEREALKKAQGSGRGRGRPRKEDMGMEQLVEIDAAKAARLAALAQKKKDVKKKRENEEKGDVSTDAEKEDEEIATLSDAEGTAENEDESDAVKAREGEEVSDETGGEETGAESDGGAFTLKGNGGVKRPRSRPPSKARAEIANDASKRPRGRPPKKPKTDEEAPDAAPRKRGRPSAKKGEETEDGGESSAAEDAKKNASESPKRGRGRPPKVKESNDAVATKSSPPKRTRGAPPKDSVAAAADV
ncbi:hypothetical protein BJ741DRAFT_624720 [Chytriomyces cf. hyalinus JEL632]|nr:hypothetical protein BJ741DRAFT_624720 [Chytriomyces cf. hyalinus JEL632]